MLILSRQTNQCVVLTLEDGQEIVVCVTLIERRANGKSRVSLGFDAPATVDIAREELLTRSRPLRRNITSA